MVLFKKKVKPGEHEIVKEGPEDVMHINYENYPRIPTIEEDSIVMASVIEKLAQSPSVSRVIFHQKKKYEYDYNQTQMLIEIAQIYNHFIKQKSILTQAALEVFGPLPDASLRIRNLQNIILNLLRTDPVGAFVETKRLLREEKINLSKNLPEDYRSALQPYISVLTEIYTLLAGTRLVSNAKDLLDGYSIGNREFYKRVFHPIITPDFMYTRLTSTPPIDGEVIDSYSLEKNSNVQVLNIKETIKPLYHVTPPEFQLTEDKYELLDLARKVLSEHQPKAEEFIDPEKMRDTFFNIGRDLITELAESKRMTLSFSEIEELANILVRYTVGFGLLETLLKDDNVQDIAINSPAGTTPVFLVHGKYDECITNIVPSVEDVEGWASKFRLISARPLDEANPVLDTELTIPGVRARVAIISRPLNPTGLAFSIRRHRDKPWTFPLFIANGMMNDLAAGLLSFIVDGSRSILVAGTRGSGKCVDGKTLIQLASGQIVSIKELVGKPKESIEDGKIYHPKEGYETISMNNLKMSCSKITDVWVRSSPEKLIKLKTRSGKEIITTCEHPYFIYDKGLKNIRADKLIVGELIAVPRKINTNSEKILLNIKKNEDFKFEENDNWYSISGITNSQYFRLPKEINSEIAEFLGLIIGDGHIDLEKVEFHNKCDELRERYKSILNNLNLKYREFESNTSIVVQVCCRNLSRILNKYFEIPFGKKADKVVIPQLILKSNNKILASFLKAYFDTDGYTPKDKRDIELVTASKLMSKHLEMVLSRFGIVSFSKTKNLDGVIYYRNLIRGEFVDLFAAQIGFSHPKKLDRLNKIISLGLLGNTNVDVIPDGNRILKELRAKLRISPKKYRSSGKDYWAYENNKYRVSRTGFRKIIAFSRLRYNNLLNLEYNYNKIKEFVDFDYKKFIDNVEKIRMNLSMSYGVLASDLRLSEPNVRKTLQDYKTGNIEKIQTFISLYYLYNKRLNDLNEIAKLEPRISNISKLVENNVYSYAVLSKNTGIKETALKSYVYGGIKVTEQKEEIIRNELIKIKQELTKKIKTVNSLMSELQPYTFLGRGMQIGVILSDLRNKLNIKNEELTSENVSLMTVSNFFNGTYECEVGTIKSICKKTLDIVNACVNKETEKLIKEAEMLANSDIFWDEIESIELIDKTDDFVYDLSIEGVHNFIANGIIAHNTSVLGSVLVEIMRKYRIITVEDTLELGIEAMRELGYNIQPMKVRSALLKSGSELSADEGIRTSLRMGDSSLIVGEIRSSIRGNEEVLIVENDLMKRVQIKDLEGKDISNIFIPSMDKDLNFKLKKLIAFVKHPQRNKLLEVITRTGRKITVTHDHSLFTHKDFRIVPIECKDLKISSKIIIPEKLPIINNAVKSINLFDLLEDEDCRIINYEEDLKQIINKIGYKKASEISNCSNDIYQYLRNGVQHTNITIKDYKNLAKEANYNINTTTLQIKRGTSKTLNTEIEISNDFCRFLGYYISEGWTDLNGDVVFSNGHPKIIKDIINLSRSLFNIEPYVRQTQSLGISTQINLNNKILGLMIKRLGCGRVALEKRVPAVIYSLPEAKICEFLKGYFDGDGSQTSIIKSGNRIACSTISKGLANDLLYLFLQLGIVARVYEKEPSKNQLGKHNSYIVEFKQRKYIELFLDKIGFKKYNKEIIKRSTSHSNLNTINYNIDILEKNVKLKRKFRHLRKYDSCGKEYLKTVIQESEYASDIIKTFVNGGFFLDEVKSIKEVNLDEGEYVYDLSVEPCQNFIGGFGGIMLHNTEAFALYEAMRVGALANVVAGTIHGDSPYGVFDRVVNDLQVPRTSFKATDIIIVANPVRSADGLHKFRRITQITEIRKDWETDPLAENGFVDLMRYDSKLDTLVPTEELINGDSDIIKSIASNIKEWAGNWGAVWENILLRAKIKKTLFDYSKKYGIPDLIEAKAVIQLNDDFHRACDKVTQEEGKLDSNKIFFEWEESLKRYLKLNYKV